MRRRQLARVAAIAGARYTPPREISIYSPRVRGARHRLVVGKGLAGMEAALRSWKQSESLDREAQLRAAREILRLEATALWKVSTRLDDRFTDAVQLILRSRGSVIVTGMGKAGLVGQKIAATLASTGTRSHFLHPAEAFHGDLGRVHHDDVVLVLSQSGETSEVLQLLGPIRGIGATMIAITARRESTLGLATEVVIELGAIEEACSLGLAPSTSTTAMMAVGDALALVLSKLRGFKAEDFARFHPGGSLGLRLSRVEDHMRPLAQCRLATDSVTVREVIVACSKPGRRSGAIMLTDSQARLSGIFTDSDLARLIETRDLAALDRGIAEVMTHRPITIRLGTRTHEAIDLMADRKLSELPVVDDDGLPVGMLDVTDLVGLSGEAKPVELPKVATTPAMRIFPSEDVFAGGG